MSMTIELELLIGRVRASLNRFCVGIIVVSPAEGGGIFFKIDAGPSINAVGGLCGGITSGVIEVGSLFPRMNAGRDPLGVREWYRIMYPS